MKPLRETEARSPLLRQARALLESAQPLPESRERMLRVRRALDQRKPGGALGRIPAAAMAGLIALFGASAFAAVRYVTERSAAEERAPEQVHSRGKRVHVRATDAVAPEQAPATQQGASVPAANEELSRRGGFQTSPLPEARPTAGRRTRAHVTARPVRSRSTTTQARSAAPRPVEAMQAQAPTAVPADSSSSSAPPVVRAPEPLASAAAATEEARVEPARVEQPVAPVAKDGELVHRALQALRRQDDPALAARLLAQHRKAQPSGALAEEALSLQIEAALALEDPRALMFAREYLAGYPHGRYVRVARKALAGGR